MYITTRDPSPPISASAPGTTHASSRHWRATARFPLPAQRKVHCDPSTQREGHVRRRAAAITCSTCARETRNSRAIAAGRRPASWAARISRSWPGVTGMGSRFCAGAGRVARPGVFLSSRPLSGSSPSAGGRPRRRASAETACCSRFQLGVVEIAQRSIQIGR